MKNLFAATCKSISRQVIDLALAAGLFLLAASGAIFYIVKTYKGYINSDAATSNILAGEIARSGQFFPKDWWYVNSDLWVLFKHVFVLPWAIFGNNGFEAHASAVLVGSALMVFAAYALLRQADCSQARAVVGASVLCFGFSDSYVEIVFGEAAYAWSAWYLFALMALLLGLRGQIRKNKTPTWPLIGLFFLVLIVSLANPTRFFVFFIVPVSGAVLLQTYARVNSVEYRIANFKFLGLSVFCFGLCSAAFVFAFILHRNLLAGLSNATGAAGAELVPIENLPQTFGYGINGILNLLGVGWVSGIKLASFQGLLVLAKFALYPALLIAPALVFSTNGSRLTAEQKFVVLTGYVGLALIFFLVCASSLQGGNPISAAYSTRYLLPFILLMLISNFCIWHLHTKAMQLLIIGGLALALTGSWAVLSPEKLRTLESQSNASNVGYSFRAGWRQQLEKRNSFMKALLDDGLTVGYAPYWHSHPYTLLSKGALEIRPVHMTEGNLRPWLHLSSSRWYKSGYTTGPVFLLVPKSESKSLLPGLTSTCMPVPTRQFEVDDYLVLVYKNNPLIGSFERSLDKEGKVCLSASSQTQIGNYNVQRESLESPANGIAGYLHFGPHSLIEPGTYDVAFELEVNSATGSAKDLGFVEVSADNGNRVILKETLQLGAATRVLKINIRDSAAQNVEFRVYSSGAAQVSLSGIEVRKVR